MTGMRPMFRAGWNQALFIHFRVDADRLSRAVPFPLDTFGGDAFISLVAFTQTNLRPSIGGKLAAWLSAPLAAHGFLNLRAYVLVDGKPGIYFLSEWIPNRLAALLGPRLYGLPYRLATLRFKGALHGKPMHGEVIAPGGSFRYRATIPSPGELALAAPGSIDHFLLERYAAFTYRDGIARRFQVEHVPWPQVRARAELLDTSLIESAVNGLRDADLFGAELLAGNFRRGDFSTGENRSTCGSARRNVIRAPRATQNHLHQFA